MSYEEAILARQTMIKENQQRVMEMKEEVGKINALKIWELIPTIENKVVYAIRVHAYMHSWNLIFYVFS